MILEKLLQTRDEVFCDFTFESTLDCEFIFFCPLLNNVVKIGINFVSHVLFGFLKFFIKLFNGCLIQTGDFIACLGLDCCFEDCRRFFFEIFREVFTFYKSVNVFFDTNTLDLLFDFMLCCFEFFHLLHVFIFVIFMSSLWVHRRHDLPIVSFEVFCLHLFHFVIHCLQHVHFCTWHSGFFNNL